MHKLISNNHIKIGEEDILFPIETDIKKIEKLKDVVCFNTFPSEEGMNWDKVETHEKWRKRCAKNPSELFCYSLDGQLQWKFNSYPVVGFGIIDVKSMTSKDFVDEEHFVRYVEKFHNLEILEVYAGDFRMIIDANSGVVYSQNESR